MPNAPDHRLTLLLTRPALQSARFAAAFVARFGPATGIVTAPVLVIAPLPLPVRPDGFDGVIFTSENAVAAFVAQSDWRSDTAFCVGAATAAAAAAAGFGVRMSAGDAAAPDPLAGGAGPGDGPGGGDAAALVALIAAAGPVGHLLHVRGEHAAGNVAQRLMALGIAVTQAVVYAQRPCALTAQAVARLAGPVPVLLPLFSPRSAALFSAAAPAPAAPLLVAAMSMAVAECAPSAARLIVAHRPDAAAILDALGRLIETATVP